ncbi:hypothetical protein B0G84_7495 [Paraburkholderia sp. BL8N3]|nr:hypothetical protein B0G84_7495 [Paraburkholderia sp. BL8N3]
MRYDRKMVASLPATGVGPSAGGGPGTSEGAPQDIPKFYFCLSPTPSSRGL